MQKKDFARIWGKFSGDLQIPDSTVKLDYTYLLLKDEKMKLVEELILKIRKITS